MIDQLTQIVPPPSNSLTLCETRDGWTAPLRVLHVLDLSLPVIRGYSIRSHGLISGEQALGMVPAVVTSPLHQRYDPAASNILLNGVPHFRTATDGGVSSRAVRQRWPVARELAVVYLLQRRIEVLLQTLRFDIVHAHSPVLCGLAGLRAARNFGIPFVYEIRAFWEDAAVDQAKTSTNSFRYRLTRGLENYVARHADAVVGITTSILDDLASRGLRREKLFHVCNGVDAERFQPRLPDRELSSQFNREGVPVIGFIGSLYYFEGLAWLVRAATELRRRGLCFKVLIIGEGEEAAQIRDAIQETGSSDYISFLGQVPHEEVERYYSVIDIMVYPRRSTRLTELVTPLKPLEAMAQGKAVLGSAVGGIRDLVEDETTGLLFQPMDIDDFCYQAERLIVDVPLRQKISKQGRMFVLQERDWRAISSRYVQVYRFARDTVRRNME
jgi:glycogen(starch) synthase